MEELEGAQAPTDAILLDDSWSLQGVEVFFANMSLVGFLHRRETRAAIVLGATTALLVAIVLSRPWSKETDMLGVLDAPTHFGRIIGTKKDILGPREWTDTCVEDLGPRSVNEHHFPHP